MLCATGPCSSTGKTKKDKDKLVLFWYIGKTYPQRSPLLSLLCVSFVCRECCWGLVAPRIWSFGLTPFPKTYQKRYTGRCLFSFKILNKQLHIESLGAGNYKMSFLGKQTARGKAGGKEEEDPELQTDHIYSTVPDLPGQITLQKNKVYEYVKPVKCQKNCAYDSVQLNSAASAHH